MGKTALIVDDSRSARIVLKRVLEAHDLNVDTAESAEDALVYLTENRPDAIFMDHMMPGMDGFEAVSAIKRNPQTATIPIMMYTSKKGEVYVGQARALGAVGVLPKGVAPVEVSKVLKVLRLIGEEALEQPEKKDQPNRDNGTSKAVLETPDKNLEDLIRGLFRQQRAIIQHDLQNSYDHVAARVFSKIKSAPTPEPVQLQTQSKQKPSGILLSTVVILAVSTLFFAWLSWHGNQNRHEILAQHDELRQTIVSQRIPRTTEIQQIPIPESAPNTDNSALHQQQIDEYQQSLDAISAVTVDSLNWGANQVSGYRYGEPPLGDERLKIVEQLNDYLLAIEFSGVVRIETHVANFCLTIANSEGYVLAGDILVSNCERIGFTPEEAADMGLGQSVAFANFIRLAEELSDGRIRYEIVSLGNSDPLLDYPAILDGVSASDWNQIAAVNNRVVITVVADN